MSRRNPTRKVNRPTAPAVLWGAIAVSAVWMTTPVLSACRGGSANERGVAHASAIVETADTTFAALIAEFSEAGGYFDTDNLISNETSYLHVLGTMRERGVEGGAYIGVGPDQNFSYIAQVRPHVAFIVDIRRDNMLQHLMFKALFTAAPTRLVYLCLLFGCPVPNDLHGWPDATLREMVAYVDDTPATRRSRAHAAGMVDSVVTTFHVPLSESDRATIRRFHDEFMRAGLDLRFASHNRAPQPYYPTYRQLLLERDLTGREGNYLATEDAFLFLKTKQDENLVIPAVGDLAGTHTLRAIGEWLRERGEHVSALYTSNVEFYLMGDGTFDRFATNVLSLPYDERSVIIRSYFGGRFRNRHPQSVPGYYSTQLLQSLGSFVDEVRGAGYRSYFDLINRNALELR